MTQHQQPQQQQQQHNQAQMSAQTLTQSQSHMFDSSAQQNQAMAQLASQVQAAMGQQMQPQPSADPNATPGMMNMPNQKAMAGGQFYPMNGMMQQNNLSMPQQMQSWNSAPPGYELQQPQFNNWMTNMNVAAVVAPPTPVLSSQQQQQQQQPTPTSVQTRHGDPIQPQMTISPHPPTQTQTTKVATRKVSKKEKFVAIDSGDDFSGDDDDEDDYDDIDTGGADKQSSKNSANLTPAQKARQNRERNREHARTTRLRKKAYVQKLKEMADGLRAVQTEDVRQLRASAQKMAEIQKARRSVVHGVLQFHSDCESNPQKWATLLEDDFYLKQPVTPYRFFRRSEVQRDCRILHGIEAMIADAASQSVMVERIGSRNSRWQLIKRKEFVRKHGELGGRDVDFQPVGTRLQNIDSSLSGSCSSDSSTGYVASHSKKRARSGVETSYTGNVLAGGVATNVSSASEGSNLGRMPQMYAKDNVSESSDGYNTSNNAKSLCTDASSGDDSYGGKERPLKRLPANIAKSGGIKHNFGAPQDAMTAKFNMVPTVGAQQDEAKSDFTASEGTSGPTVILNDAIGFSKDNVDELGSYYCINEDDMIVIDDILMCPFVFRSKNAVLCGALADCVMPGMLRAKFSKSNKLHSLEMIYDAMGFMQQLDRANGGDITAQIIPGSLEMALIHCPHEARVITEATPPYKIVYVNESWTRLTNYSQLEVEGQDLMSLLEGEDTDSEAGVRPGKPVHSLGEVAKGRPACSTNLHYNKDGQPFLDFMSSYPLTNSEDEISHLLHVNTELPRLQALVNKSL